MNLTISVSGLLRFVEGSFLLIFDRLLADVLWGCSYSLEFDGDEEEGRVGLPTKTVPFNNVVQLPSGHRQ